jgi:TonB family protein
MERRTKMSFNRQTGSTINRTNWYKSILLIGVPLTIFGLMLTALIIVHAETIEAGNLNGKALSLPAPAYPPLAKQARMTGTVKVDVLVNESGKVETAKAPTGNMMLRQAAADAALKAKFAPTLKAGVPVKVAGYLQYEFKLD